jgi:hypothetical protein
MTSCCCCYLSASDLLLGSYVDLHGRSLSVLVQRSVGSTNWLLAQPPRAPRPVCDLLLERLGRCEAELMRLVDTSGRSGGAAGGLLPGWLTACCEADLTCAEQVRGLSARGAYEDNIVGCQQASNSTRVFCRRSCGVSTAQLWVLVQGLSLSNAPLCFLRCSCAGGAAHQRAGSSSEVLLESAAVERGMAKLFRGKVQPFGSSGLRFTQSALLAAVAIVGLKSLVEFIRLQTLGKAGEG